MTEKPLKCPFCEGEHITKAGMRVTVKGRKQRYQCMTCGKTFYKEEEDKQ